MKPLPLSLLAFTALCLCSAGGLAQAQVQAVPPARTALLMGVWDYQDPTFPPLPQKGIESDLTRMEAKLKALGFAVTVVKNPSLSAAKKAVDGFGAQLLASGGASLFYFTGHGSEHEGKNFLIPAGTAIAQPSDLDDEALSANRVLDRMEGSGIKVNLIFLDCCRNSLTKAGGETGLAPMSARGALIGFATRSGDVAEASEAGSPYTNALLNHLDRPGVSLTDMHALVTQELERSGSQRRPGHYADLSGIYHLVPAAAGTAVAPLGGLMPPALAPAVAPTPAPGVLSKAASVDQGSVGSVISLPLPGSALEMKFCFCPPGRFFMGSPKGETNRGVDEDQAQVRITQGFWTGQTEVTQRQWRAVMGDDPSEYKGDDLPVETVSWEKAAAFVRRLNEQGRPPAGWRYALLTEAQWEYACRAGTETVFHTGDALNSSQANFDGRLPYGSNPTSSALEKPSSVARYPANAWGLHDMHGNVLEWCADWYALEHMGGNDPQGGAPSEYRVLRGGSWVDDAVDCRAATRHMLDPNEGNMLTGLRVALVKG